MVIFNLHIIQTEICKRNIFVENIFPDTKTIPFFNHKDIKRIYLNVFFVSVSTNVQEIFCCAY